MSDYVSTSISTFIEFINNSVEAYQEAIKDLSEADRETQDILHFIEFEKVDACAMSRAYKKLKIVRIKRRCAKNTIELLQPLVEWHNKYGNVLIPLNKKTLPTIQASELSQETRTYHFRTNILKDITSKTHLKEENGRG